MIDQEILADDLSDFMASFTGAIDVESVIVLRDLASSAQDQLKQLDSDAGHHALSLMWTYSLDPNDDGAKAEVFSEAEEMIFLNRTGSFESGRPKSPLYPIQGNRLLAILEGGAEAHQIIAGTVNPMAKMLSIPTPPTTTYRKSVEHPGVVANEHIEMTGEAIEGTLDQAADTSAQNVADRLNGA